MMNFRNTKGKFGFSILYSPIIVLNENNEAAFLVSDILDFILYRFELCSRKYRIVFQFLFNEVLE